MKKNEIRNTMILVLAAVIWGSAFVAQSVGAEFVGPFTFLALRSYLGALVLLPIVLITKRKIGKETIKAGIIVGIWLTIASYLQQVGIAYTTTAKAGFITTMYVIFVPFISFFLFKKPIAKKIWLCVALSVSGLYLLCHMSFNLGYGDIMVFACALMFSGHILTVDHFNKIDGVCMSFIQFSTVAIVSTICMFLFEEFYLSAVISASTSILYAGVMSSGIAYTLQLIGQKGVNPTVASIAMSLESAFAAVFGFIILGQALTVGEFVGCTLMFASIIISQI